MRFCCFFAPHTRLICSDRRWLHEHQKKMAWMEKPPLLTAAALDEWLGFEFSFDQRADRLLDAQLLRSIDSSTSGWPSIMQ